MNSINSRIEALVNHFSNGNVSKFAAIVGTSEANIRNYINGTEPKFSVIEKIVKSFEINYEWLLLGTGEMFENNKTSVVSEPPTIYSGKVPSVITVDSADRDNIVLVPVYARAGYLEGYYKPEFIRTLPTYRMPGLNNGTFRAFENKGQSMNLTFHDRSFAVGEFVEDWSSIKDNRIYIIVHEDWDADQEGVLIKRCLNRIKKYNNLVCKSDNLDRRSYPNINLDPSSIKEVWEVKGGLMFEFPDPSSIFDRMNDLEAELSSLKKYIITQ